MPRPGNGRRRRWAVADRSGVSELALCEDMGRLSLDPLTWTAYAFPWGKGELTGFEGPDVWQRDVLRTMRDHLKGPERFKPLRIAVASGHGIGKSALVAWVILWALSTCPDARGVVTANTGVQLRTKTWAELGKWYNRFLARHWFAMASTSITAKEAGHESTWRLDSVQWSKENSEAFAGMHNQGKRIVVIFDEASAIDDTIWEVTEGALTDRDTEIVWLAFGNPTRNTGRFRECFRKYRDRWRHVHIDSRTAAMTNKEQLEQWVRDYGEESDFVKVRVRGMFPDASDTQLISAALVRAAKGRYIQERDIAGAPVIMGIDVAGTGADQSSVWLRQGLWARRLFKRHTPDSMIFADRLVSLIHEHKPDVAFIDMGAMGAPVRDRLNQLGFGDVVQGVYFGGEAMRKDLYANRRAEMWHAVAGWLRDGGVLPHEGPEAQDIEDDLCAPEYFYNTRGRLQLESKDDIKDRGLPSPDDGDALALTFAAPVAPRHARQDDEGENGWMDGYSPFTW